VSFVHDDRDFPQLLTLVTEETRIAPALVEKDYWVTHCMWALHQTGLDLWFKGGTSLSKGYVSTMFWGPRVPVDEACATIREWIREHLA